MVTAIDLQLVGLIPFCATFVYHTGQVVHTHVTKQYQPRSIHARTVRKVTTGLALHWPCIADSLVYPLDTCCMAQIAK